MPTTLPSLSSGEWSLRFVNASDAVQFVKTHHYSRSAHEGWWRRGLYVRDELKGVTIYNAGGITARDHPFGPERRSEVIHHHRLALAADCPRNTATWFLARAMRELSSDRPELRAVLTYADTAAGHSGTIYQALNGLYTGLGARGHIYWVNQEGETLSQSSRVFKGLTFKEKIAYADVSGWKCLRSRGKHRYLILLGPKSYRKESLTLLRPPVLPYPAKELT